MLPLLFFVSEVFKCVHDAESDKQLRRSPPTALDDGSPSDFTIHGREKIRIIFDLTPIEFSGVDTVTCTGAGSPSDKCLATDVIVGDTKRVDVVKKTFEAVRDYIQHLIKVTPYNLSLDPSNELDDPASRAGNNIEPEAFKARSPHYKDGLFKGECDLFIPVVGRGMGETSRTLATASALARNQDNRDKNRPVLGLITLNPSKLPTTAQNATSGGRQFFVTVVHELMHILAFSASAFNYWVDTHDPSKPGFGANYAPSAMTYTNSWGLRQQFLVTPNLQRWVMERFQVVNHELLSLGLEIEDGGGSGTANSHPNSRLYFTDVMQGKTFGPGWISPIFALSLMDAGWYDVNTSEIEPLVYMDATLHGTSPPNQNALIQPPKLSFPPDYLCDSVTYAACFYDYSAKGACRVNNSEDVLEGALDKVEPWVKWYNPDGAKEIGIEELVDYAPIVLPSFNCRDSGMPERESQAKEMVDKLHEVYGDDSVCAMSTIFNGDFGEIVLGALPACFRARCGTDGKIRLTLDDDREQICTRTGRKIYSKKHIGHVLCPPAQEACATHSKFHVISITQAIPDRGPFDGKNFILFKGYGLNKFTKLKLKIGEVELELLHRDDESILSKFPELDQKAVANIPQNLTASDPDFPHVEGTLVNFYTFTDRSYNAAWSMATPAVLLLVVAIVVAAFI